MRILPLSFAAIISAGSAFAVDDCLVGTWQADLDDLAEIMGGQMNGSATPIGGDVSMTITADNMINMVINDLVLNVVVPDVPAMDVSVRGTSGGPFEGEGGNWSVTTASYDLVGSANVMGQTMTIPFTSDTGMFGSGSGSYVCDGDTVTFTSDTPDPRLPRRWSRSG